MNGQIKSTASAWRMFLIWRSYKKVLIKKKKQGVCVYACAIQGLFTTLLVT